MGINRIDGPPKPPPPKTVEPVAPASGEQGDYPTNPQRREEKRDEHREVQRMALVRFAEGEQARTIPYDDLSTLRGKYPDLIVEDDNYRSVDEYA